MTGNCGNVAAMREALTRAVTYLEYTRPGEYDRTDSSTGHYHDDHEAVIAAARAALSARETAPGNAAAMREALTRIHKFVAMHTGDWTNDDERAVIDQTIAALSTPARNCDRFQTADEAWADWTLYITQMGGEDFLYNYHFGNWLFAPAKGDAE